MGWSVRLSFKPPKMWFSHLHKALFVYRAMSGELQILNPEPYLVIRVISI